MLYDQFVITYFDVTTGKGYARQTVNANRFPLRTEPIGFSTGIGKGICESTNSGGIRIPSEAIARRVPEIGEAIMGVIALALGDSTAELDEHGFPFLRNWVYKDQHDEAMARERDLPDEELNDPADSSGFYDEARCGGDRPGLMVDDESDERAAADYMDDEDYPEDEDEDPLAGDVEPTGGCYEPLPDPFTAQRLAVMRQHGDYTG